MSSGERKLGILKANKAYLEDLQLDCTDSGDLFKYQVKLSRGDQLLAVHHPRSLSAEEMVAICLKVTREKIIFH